MILDSLLQFSAAQSLVGSASVASTNSVDLTSARKIGVGEELFIALEVTTAFASATSVATVTVTLQGSAASNFSSPVNQVLGTFPALSPIGQTIIQRIQPGSAGDLEFQQLLYTVNNENLTAGAVSAAITHDADLYSSYPRGYSVL